MPLVSARLRANCTYVDSVVSSDNFVVLIYINEAASLIFRIRQSSWVTLNQPFPWCWNSVFKTLKSQKINSNMWIFCSKPTEIQQGSVCVGYVVNSFDAGIIHVLYEYWFATNFYHYVMPDGLCSGLSCVINVSTE